MSLEYSCCDVPCKVVEAESKFPVFIVKCPVCDSKYRVTVEYLEG